MHGLLDSSDFCSELGLKVSHSVLSVDPQPWASFFLKGFPSGLMRDGLLSW